MVFVGEANTSKSFYEETIDKVEKAMSIGETWLFKIAAPFFILPKVVESFYRYFAMGSSEDAFELIFDAS